jgi:hypothetical protein
VTIALPALSGGAWAGGTDDYGCSNATIKGEYAFGATNFTTPRVVAGIKVFDGKGNLTQRDYRGNSVPAEFAPPGQETGTYTVNKDCTGNMEIDLNAPVLSGSTGVIKILFVIADGGRHIHEVVSESTPAGINNGTPTCPNQLRRLGGRLGARPLDFLAAGSMAAEAGAVHRRHSAG